ncbi:MULTISPECIES: MaoC/PaaZ C-terminal domain-containing protein [Ferrimonas]|uniref:MaoC/PaaZ C-terminal domain-containing protein n=1 Tax=Ferrimonas TaxID=44011 RepID=UPI0003F68713|nr:MULTISPECIES: MaoC/PaaZ C-terminal domain-containing protein [Ferrimonas]USD38484.1 3-alpha,7-alpha,12-alpha-trihydroxy-5-beta-cholest-24-enoyl-CoA hydratase [Ferrimonas sp. SCSIO 43195]
MAIKLETIGQTYGPYHTDYDITQLIVFALGSGAASDGKTDLDWAYEQDLRINPVYLATIVASDKVTADIDFGFDWAGILHWGIDMQIHKPLLETSGTLSTNITLNALYDRGEGRGCLAQKIAETYDQHGDKLLTIDNWDCAIYDGGFGGEKAPRDIVEIPDRQPDYEIDETLSLNQPVIFRLLGNYHPLHVDWDYAQKYGYDRPIHMALAVSGMACRHICNTLLERQPQRLTRFKLRFTGVSYPGMTVTTQIWRWDDHSVRFRVIDKNNPDTVLLNFALAEWQ